MGNVVPLVDPQDYKRVHQRIKRLWREGNYEPLPHAQERMQQRSIDILDIQNVLLYGRVTEHSLPGEQWRYTVQGLSVEGIRLACVVEINGSLTLVSVVDVSRRRG